MDNLENKNLSSENVASKNQQNLTNLTENNPNVEEDIATISARENKVAASEYKGAKWYSVSTYVGYEQMAAENLKKVAENYNLENRILDIVIPTEEVIEEKKGKRVLVTRKTMPGYLLVKMYYGNDIWHRITGTRGVNSFVGPRGRPLPLSDEEVQKLKLEKIKVEVDVKVNDKVQIMDGPLESQIGVVTSLDLLNGKVRVMVNMFGRDMPVDLELNQIKVIE